MKVLALLLLAFALAFGQNQHIDTTNVVLAEEIDETSEHFLVSIDRIEDEIDVNGVLLAERDIHVALQFDVVENQQVSLNGVPVNYGYSELQVVAQIIEVDAEGQKSPFEELVQVSVRIFVGTRMLQLEDGTPVSAIYIQERVVGLQSKEVWQATVKEQVFIVRKDGTVDRLEVVEIEILEGEVAQPPEEVAEEKPKHGHGHGHHGGHHNQPNQQEVPQQQEEHESHHKKCSVKRMWHQFKHWFSSQTFSMRLLVSFSMGVLLGCVCFAVLKVIRCCCCGSKCQKKAAQQQQQQEQQQQQDAFKKNIHLYSLQYVEVPQDEKAEKKVQETA